MVTETDREDPLTVPHMREMAAFQVVVFLIALGVVCGRSGAGRIRQRFRQGSNVGQVLGGWFT